MRVRTTPKGRRILGRGAIMLAAGLVTAGVVGAPAGGSAASAGDAFGSHVATCTRTMGFTGEMNPGMHTGFAGWDPSHTC